MIVTGSARRPTRRPTRSNPRAERQVPVPDEASSEHSSAAQLQLRSGDLKWTATDQGITVLDMRTARYLQLNRSGAVV